MLSDKPPSACPPISSRDNSQKTLPRGSLVLSPFVISCYRDVVFPGVVNNPFAFRLTPSLMLIVIIPFPHLLPGIEGSSHIFSPLFLLRALAFPFQLPVIGRIIEADSFFSRFLNFRVGSLPLFFIFLLYPFPHPFPPKLLFLMRSLALHSPCPLLRPISTPKIPLPPLGCRTPAHPLSTSLFLLL